MKRASWVVAAIVLLCASLLAWANFAPMPPERAAALGLLLRPTPPVAGRDASDAFWLLGHDVPKRERATIAAEYRRYLQAKADREEHADAPTDPPLVNPLDRFPAFPKVDGVPGLCELKAGDCLANVRADPAATASALARHAAQLRAARELSDFDGERIHVKPSLNVPIPYHNTGHRLVYTALAQRYASGETEAAIADTCRDLAGWRRLGADSDTLVGGVIGTAYASYDLRLLGAMLAERAAETPLPASCAEALAPTRDAELDVCPLVRGEFTALHNTAKMPPDAVVNGFGDDYVLAESLDPKRLAEFAAPAFARPCGRAMLDAARADLSTRTVARTDARCRVDEWVAHFAECREVRTMPAEFDPTVDRRTDLAAQLASMRTWLWLRAREPDATRWPALLSSRPATLGLRRDAFVRDGQLLIPLYDTRNAEYFGLPLPATPAAPTSRQ